jgi:hypothetical protein
MKTIELPPIDNIRLAKSSSSIVYDGYVKAAFENEKFKRKLGSILLENQYWTLEVKALEAEKGVLEEKLVSLGKDSQTAIEVVHFLREKQEQIKALEATRSAAAFPIL